MPIYKCRVLNCANTSGVMRFNRISFYAFPQNPEICKEWVVRCGQPKAFCANRSRICSIHFRENDYDDSLGTKTMRTRTKVLKTGCVPTLHLPDVIEITSAKKYCMPKRTKRAIKEEPVEEQVKKPKARVGNNAGDSSVKNTNLKFNRKVFNQQGTSSTTLNNSAFVLKPGKKENTSQKSPYSKLASSLRLLSPIIGKSEDSSSDRSDLDSNLTVPILTKGFGTQSKIAVKQVQAKTSLPKAKAHRSAFASASKSNKTQLKKSASVPAPVESLPQAGASTSQTSASRSAKPKNRSGSASRSSNSITVPPKAFFKLIKVVATQTQAMATQTQAMATQTQAMATQTQAIATQTQAISKNSRAVRKLSQGVANLCHVVAASFGAASNTSNEVAELTVIPNCSVKEDSSLKRKLLFKIAKNSKLKARNKNLPKRVAEMKEDAHIYANSNRSPAEIA